MTRATAGDRSAYQKLLEEIADVMEAYLRRRFGDFDFVEECVQECLLSIHRSRASYDPSRAFRPWMFTIVRHKAIDFLRRKGARPRGTSDEVATADSAPSRIARGALEHRVQAAQVLRELDAVDRDALVMTKIEGYSLAEAAGRAGVSTTAMKSRVHRALGRARRILEAEMNVAGSPEEAP